MQEEPKKPRKPRTKKPDVPVTPPATWADHGNTALERLTTASSILGSLYGGYRGVQHANAANENVVAGALKGSLGTVGAQLIGRAGMLGKSPLAGNLLGTYIMHEAYNQADKKLKEKQEKSASYADRYLRNLISSQLEHAENTRLAIKNTKDGEKPVLPERNDMQVMSQAHKNAWKDSTTSEKVHAVAQPAGILASMAYGAYRGAKHAGKAGNSKIFGALKGGAGNFGALIGTNILSLASGVPEDYGAYLASAGGSAATHAYYNKADKKLDDEKDKTANTLPDYDGPPKLPRYDPAFGHNPVHALSQMTADFSALHPHLAIGSAGLLIGLLAKHYLDKKKEREARGWQ